MTDKKPIQRAVDEPSNGEPQAPIWQDEALKEARRLGDTLRDNHNMQPSPELKDGTYSAYSPPPTRYDLGEGKGNVIY